MSDDLIKDPLYFQATERLRQCLRRGEFAPGAQFLTERQIAERFAISRATANKALAGLVSEGALEFRKGVGTFVRDAPPLPPIDIDLRALVSFTEKARVAGKSPTTQVLALDPLESHPTFAPGEPLWQLERLRLADGVPVLVEKRLLVRRHCPELTPERAAGSLYAYLTDALGLTVAGAEQTIAAVGAKKREARRLDVAVGAPCLCVTATARLADGQPLWWERAVYRGDAYVFHNRLGPHPHAALGALQ